MPSSGLVITQLGDVTVVNFRNASILDGPTVKAISDELHALVDQQAQRKVLLDFSSVRFLSSSMLSVLIAMRTKAKAIKGRVILAGFRPKLREIFKITSTDKLFEFADTESQALACFDVFLES
ncbi:MAG: STAS domain-containing protein [Planctomycetota bacterium]|nr:STAS domain-containing protein [Planctomycetota bacterium]